MKKTITILVFLLWWYQSGAQSSHFGAKGGLNLAILSGTVNMEPKYKPGLMLGFYLDAAVTEKFHIQPELVYSSQGAKIEYTDSPAPGSRVVGETTTSLSYINIPVMAKIYLGKVVNLQLGPQVGILVSATDKGTIQGDVIDDDLKDIFKGVDFSFATGIGLNLPSGVNFGGRLIFGLSNLNKDNGQIAPGIERPALTNGVIQFSLGVPLAKF